LSISHSSTILHISLFPQAIDSYFSTPRIFDGCGKYRWKLSALTLTNQTVENTVGWLVFVVTCSVVITIIVLGPPKIGQRLSSSISLLDRKGSLHALNSISFPFLKENCTCNDPPYNILSYAFVPHKLEFLKGHPSWYYYQISSFNYKILIGYNHYGFKTRYVKNVINIHISTLSFIYSSNVRCHNHLLLKT
jgi:hypothetical protein